MNDVCLDGAEGLVFDDDEDLLLFFQVYEVTEPRFLGKPVYIKDREKTQDYVFFLIEYFLTRRILPLQLNVVINIRPQRK